MHDMMATKIKRKQTYLSNTDRWVIATFCIENRCVIQDIDLRVEKGNKFIPFTLWRVTKKTACEEVNRELKLECSSHHLDQSVAFYNEVCLLTGSHPVVPPVQDTVEMDMLTAANKRLENDLKEVTNEYQKLQTQYNALLKGNGLYFNKLKEIANIIPADCFGKKNISTIIQR